MKNAGNMTCEVVFQSFLLHFYLSRKVERLVAFACSPNSLNAIKYPRKANLTSLLGLALLYFTARTALYFIKTFDFKHTLVFFFIAKKRFVLEIF